MRNLLAIIAAICGAGWSAAMADEPLRVGPPGGAVTGVPPRADIPAPVRPVDVPAAGAQLVPPTGSPIVLEAGKGTLIRLSRAASTVFIANPDVADVQVKSPSLIYLTAKAPGQTALYAVDAEDRVLLNAPVRVEHDLSRLRQSIHALAPGQNVTVSSVDNALVLGGTVASAGEAATVGRLANLIARETKGDVSNRMVVATPNQVNIRVKVAEVDREVLKAIGVNWRTVFRQIRGEDVGQTLFTNPMTGLPNAFGTLIDNPVTDNLIRDQNQIAFAFGGGNTRTQVLLDALAQENLLVTLAEPNLTATNGQPAAFLAGGEFPVPVATTTAGGFLIPTIEFKTFGVALDVTPTIIDAEHLVLKIRTGVSELTNTGAVVLNDTSIPGLTTRRAETTVELGSGQSFVLGGLLQNAVTQNISKIPWLGDIPILGQLFRSERFRRRETELVIIVTPYLVKPANQMLATPVDGFRAPHDAQRVATGSVYRQGLPAPSGVVAAPGSAPVGPIGFRLD
ncbi:MAG: type II and III secretion system protein family protein [Alphaproteobacteria bacterium]